MGNSKKSTKMMKLTILLVLIAATFAQKVVKAHPSCKLAISKNGRCGKALANTRCPAGFYSRWNWCGGSALHKKTHQAAFDARKCPKAKAAKKVVKKIVKKPVKKIVKKVSAGCKLRLSKNGRCGARYGKTRCTRAGVYCSRWGWCGTSALHKRTHQPLYDGRNCGKVVKKRVVKKAKKITLKLKAKKAKKSLKKKIVKKAKKAKKVIKKKAKKVVKKAKKIIKKAKKAKIVKKAKKAIKKKAKKVVKKIVKKAKKAKKIVKKAKRLSRRSPKRARRSSRNLLSR